MNDRPVRWCFRCRARLDTDAPTCPTCGRGTGAFIDASGDGVAVDAFGDPETIRLGKVGAPVDRELPKFLAEQYGVAALHVRDIDVERETLARVPREVATRLRALPVDTAGGILVVAVADPSDRAALGELARASGMTVEVVVSPLDEIDAALLRCYG